MTAEQLIEAEAKWLCLNTENRTSEYWYNLLDRSPWFDLALAHFHQLNEWGVRVLGVENNDNPETTLVAVNRLPEGTVLNALTFDQAIVELGKAHLPEAKE